MGHAAEGFTRKRAGKGFVYLDTAGRKIRSRKVRSRLDKLRIPPAWTDVWITNDPNSRLLATGRDSKGRKQYRYHPCWREQQDHCKFSRIINFAKHLPVIRRKAKQDLKLEGLPREKVLAAVLLLLERTRIRVGNEEYARINQSYGLTTLQDRHAKLEGASITFRFVGKGGKHHTIKIADRSLAPVIKRCRALPGTDFSIFR
jgi:DNA topoisomerase I